MTDFIETEKLYPLKFEPIYQRRVWGGTLMSEKLRRDPPAGTGESWEVSDRPEAQSRIANGELAGAELGQLVRRYGAALIGSAAQTSDRFPLLVKLIDAGERLSLQVHPDAEAAESIGNGAEPKTEMWYVIDSRPGSVILAGMNSRSSRQLLEDKLHSAEVEQLFQSYPSVPGDAYFIPAGLPHAIGAGNLILEIQQNSDTTYRLSDWGRVDSQGRARELHVENGLRSIHFAGLTSPRVAGVFGKAPRNRKYDIINRCPYFYVCELHLTERWNDDTSSRSFHLLSVVSGGLTVRRGAQSVKVAAGETALVPACWGVYQADPETPGEETIVIKTTL